MKTLVIDIETTGIPPKGADYKIDYMSYPYIVSLAYKINGEETKEFIINQEGRKIPPETIAIHGITDEMSDKSPHLLDKVLISLVNESPCNFIIGHNIYFDTSIIKANIYRLHNASRLEAQILPDFEDFLHKDKRIDTMRAGQKHCGGKWPKLTELYFKLFNENFEAHSAKNDVDACYRCYLKMKELGVINDKSCETATEVKQEAKN